MKDRTMKRNFFVTHPGHEPERVQRRAGVPPARRARQSEREDLSAVGFAAGGRRDACPTLKFVDKGAFWVACLRFSAYLGTMNRGIGAPASGPARSKGNLDGSCRAGGRRSGLWRAVAIGRGLAAVALSVA